MSKTSIFCVLVILVFWAMICSNGHLNVSGETEKNYVSLKIFVFLRDVIKLDMEKYSVLPYKPALSNRDDLGGLPEIGGKLVLNSLDDLSQIDVIYTVVNNTVNSMGLDVRAGRPLFSQPMRTDPKEMANDFLERYQAYNGDSDLSLFRSMVENCDFTKNSSVTSGNIRQEVTLKSDTSWVIWKYVYNGAVYSGLGIGFKDDLLFSFGDDRSYLRIGGTDVNVTKEKALSIGLESAKNYHYRYNEELVSNFSILTDRMGAELFTGTRDKPLELYPYWTLTFPLEHEYPGFINWIEVRLWADTGEIIATLAMGRGGGALPLDTANEPSGSSSPTTAVTHRPSDLTLNAGVIASVIIIVVAFTAATTVIYEKRKKANNNCDWIEYSYYYALHGGYTENLASDNATFDIYDQSFGQCQHYEGGSSFQMWGDGEQRRSWMRVWGDGNYRLGGI